MSVRVQLEGPDLAPLLARVRTEHGPGVQIVGAEKVRSGGVGGFFAREHYVVTVEVPDASSASSSHPTPHPVEEPTTVDATDILALADQVSAAERASVSLSTDGTAFADVLAGITSQTGDLARRARDDEPRSVPPVRRQEPPLPAPAVRVHPFRPAPLVPTAVPPQVARAQPAPLVTAPIAAPAALPLPRKPGRLIAVIGPPGAVWAAARAVAGAVGVDLRSVVIAAPRDSIAPPARPGRRISAVSAVRRNRPQWLRAPRPVVVAVETPLGDGPATAWARDVLDELQPTVRVAAVSATMRTVDAGRWIRAVGGAGALAVMDATATDDPSDVLRLGIPVAVVDGQRATPRRLAALARTGTD